jgi:hypothetical protein
MILILLTGFKNSFHELYLGPATFKIKDAHKEYVNHTNVVWTEFDGNSPDWSEFPGEPSLIVQSSMEGHTHVYWKLSEPLSGAQAIEEITRRITYNFNADTSAWDATQVLRPPGTVNYKRDGLPVFIREHAGTLYGVELFNELAPAPKPVEANWSLSELPDTLEVLLRYQFPIDINKLFRQETVEHGKRSSALMNLAYGLCQMGLSDNEVFVLLRNADDRWGKFKNRKDRDKRLAHIITVARNKYPDLPGDSPGDGDSFTIAVDYRTFLDAEISIDWLVAGILMDNGNMLFTGPSNIGKTQLSLQFAKHIALGKDILGFKVPKPKKVMILSLEMGWPDLQVFMRAQDKAHTPEERAILKDNLIVVPHGEAWPLNTPRGQEQLKILIEQFQPEGIFVDSIGSAILGNISNAEVVQTFTNFNDHIRKKYGLFLWYIHHTRKAAQGQTSFGQDDIYGDQYLNNRATSSFIMRKSKGTHIRLINTKNRLAKQLDDFFVVRDEDTLYYDITTADITEQIESLGGAIEPPNDSSGTGESTNPFPL